MKRQPSAVHKDCRSPKYRMRVERQRKGKGSFRRDKRVAEPEGERGAEK